MLLHGYVNGRRSGLCQARGESAGILHCPVSNLQFLRLCDQRRILPIWSSIRGLACACKSVPAARLRLSVEMIASMCGDTCRSDRFVPSYDPYLCSIGDPLCTADDAGRSKPDGGAAFLRHGWRSDASGCFSRMPLHLMEAQAAVIESQFLDVKGRLLHLVI